MDGWTDLLIRRHILILVHKERKYKDRKKNIYIYITSIYIRKKDLLTPSVTWEGTSFV